MYSVLASGPLVASLALTATTATTATTTATTATTTVTTATTAVTRTTTATTTPPTSPVGVAILNINGSGCKQGTVAVAVSPNKTAFTVGYSDYTAQIGGGAKSNDASQVCRLNLRVSASEGYAYAIDTVDYRGYANLAAGASAELRSSYRFHGSQRTQVRIDTLAGPNDDNWQFTDVPQRTSPVFGPCGKPSNLDIDTELSVAAGTSDPSVDPSYLSMDSTDGTITTTYHVTWQRCGLYRT